MLACRLVVTPRCPAASPGRLTLAVEVYVARFQAIDGTPSRLPRADVGIEPERKLRRPIALFALRKSRGNPPEIEGGVREGGACCPSNVVGEESLPRFDEEDQGKDSLPTGNSLRTFGRRSIAFFALRNGRAIEKNGARLIVTLACGRSWGLHRLARTQVQGLGNGRLLLRCQPSRQSSSSSVASFKSCCKASSSFSGVS